MNAENTDVFELIHSWWRQLEEVVLPLLDRIQYEKQLQNGVFLFVLGVAVGWFLRSLLASRRGQDRSSPNYGGDAVVTTKGKTKEQVELDARRRL